MVVTVSRVGSASDGDDHDDLVAWASDLAVEGAAVREFCEAALGKQRLDRAEEYGSEGAFSSDLV